MILIEMVTVNPAPNKYVIMEGSAKGWTITTTSGTNPVSGSNTTADFGGGNYGVYPSASGAVRWDTSSAPEGKAVETTITVTDDKAKGTTTYTGTAIDMGYVSSSTAPSGQTTQYAPVTSQHLVQSNPNLPLTKAEIEQQRGVSFPSDWGLTATPIASTSEGTMYSYSFYSISQRDSEFRAKGMIEEARGDAGKNLALSTLIALRKPENVMTSLYIAGSKRFAILGASNPEFESWRLGQTTEIVQDIKYYQTHGGWGAYAVNTAWESYPMQNMAIPYVGGIAVGKVMNFALPRVAGAIGGAVGKVSPRVASAGSWIIGKMEAHPRITTAILMSPVVYGEAKYTYDVGTSGIPTSQKVGLIGTEYLKTGITLTALQRGFEEGFVPESKYYLQARGGKEVAPEKMIKPEVLSGEQRFPSEYYRNPKGVIEQFKSGKYTYGQVGGIHATDTGSAFAKEYVPIIEGARPDEFKGLWVSPSGSTNFLRLGNQNYYTNLPPTFKLLPTGDYPAMNLIIGGQIKRIPTPYRYSFAKGNRWLETKSATGKIYAPTPAHEVGGKLETEGGIPFRGGTNYLVRDNTPYWNKQYLGLGKYDYVLLKNRFGTNIPVRIQTLNQITVSPSAMANIPSSKIGKGVSGQSDYSYGLSRRPSNLVSSIYSPSRYSSIVSSRGYPSYSSSSATSSSYSPSYSSISKSSVSKSSTSRSSYPMSSMSSVSSPYSSSVTSSSFSNVPRPPPVTKLFPDWDMDFVRKGMFNMPKIDRNTKYKPSAIGNVFNIRGKQPKTVTGTEFARPISGKRAWLNKLVKL